MFEANVAFDTQVLNDIQAYAQQLPDLVDEGVRRDIRPFVSQRVDQTLRREPPPPKHPLRWQSEKQRRAFFATDGFGHGTTGYKRRHKLVKRWQVRADYRQGFGGIRVTNPAPHAQYVFGPVQQLFHKDTGWANAPNTLQVISLEAQDRLDLLWARLTFAQYRRGGARG